MSGDYSSFFSGKRVLITGAGQGIGFAIASNLAKYGATILAVDLNENCLKQVKTQIPNAVPIPLDITNWSLTADTIAKHFPIDLLVNNAGLAIINSLESVTETDYERSFNVNVKAPINITKLFISELVARQSPGAVVNMSSQASKAALLNLYCATKGAVDAFTRAVALEYGPKNIRVNTVNPTVVMTDMGRQVWSDPEVKKPMMDKIPLKRFAEIQDVVEAVTFLLSDRAQMITGHSLPVDGGFLSC